MKSLKSKINVKSKKKIADSKTGTLIMIGGAEDKDGIKVILKEVVRRAGNGKIIVITAASSMPELLYESYEQVFLKMGAKSVSHLYIEQPEQAQDPKILEIFEGANTVFFTGGDQLRITTKLGGTDVIGKVVDIYKNGGTIAGTSAGASAMGKTMLISTKVVETHKVGNWMMAPGLGLIDEMLIDQHFAQRGRIGRLLGAIALNPGVLGIGIDEDTAILVENDSFRVIGSNAVYVIDGRTVTYTNISQASADRTMSMHDVTLHILSQNEKFHIFNRKIEYSK